ncbi:IS200/IS605 family transposase [Rhodocytophaga rosea]|uniref:IS200/IS605 family transposase n=1 Tax=Rhodocytophaga rosea TaxID=2704465 RepID=A0A6C0GXC1_9BACT|nr:IS200/IS605 family transposase [Rhodocytophaga rosea]
MSAEKKALSGIVAEWVEELLRGICKEHEVKILKGHVSKDHLDLFVSVLPHLAISKVVQYLKSKSLQKLLSENKDLSKAFLGMAYMRLGLLCSNFG